MLLVLNKQFLLLLPHLCCILNSAHICTTAQEPWLTAETPIGSPYHLLPHYCIIQCSGFFLGAGDNKAGEMLLQWCEMWIAWEAISGEEFLIGSHKQGDRNDSKYGSGSISIPQGQVLRYGGVWILSHQQVHNKRAKQQPEWVLAKHSPTGRSPLPATHWSCLMLPPYPGSLGHQFRDWVYLIPSRLNISACEMGTGLNESLDPVALITVWILCTLIKTSHILYVTSV